MQRCAGLFSESLERKAVRKALVGYLEREQLKKFGGNEQGETIFCQLAYKKIQSLFSPKIQLVGHVGEAERKGLIDEDHVKIGSIQVSRAHFPIYKDSTEAAALERVLSKTLISFSYRQKIAMIKKELCALALWGVLDLVWSRYSNREISTPEVVILASMAAIVGLSFLIAAGNVAYDDTDCNKVLELDQFTQEEFMEFVKEAALLGLKDLCRSDQSRITEVFSAAMRYLPSGISREDFSKYAYAIIGVSPPAAQDGLGLSASLLASEMP